MKTRNLFIALITLFITSGLLMSCDSEVSTTGTAGVKVTDAAVDAENITGVYLSVSEVKAHGNAQSHTITSFDSPKTFNVMDYQNGSTFDLGEGEINAGSYNELRLILAEGSYVAFKDGSTEPLDVSSGTSSGYKIKGDYQIASNNKTDLVIDIDLRKAFVKTGNDLYKLRPTARLVNAENTGTIRGTVTASGEDRVVVYAYSKGSYNASETDTPADGESRFESSVNSAVVANGQFKLAFMEPGEYDLITVAYEQDEANETYTFKSATKAEVMLNGNILDLIEVAAKAEVIVVLNPGF
ncbi:MAG: DUF4382 domain-containing protein [Marinoscillum sp.]